MSVDGKQRTHMWVEMDGKWVKVVHKADPDDILARFARSKNHRLRATAAIMAIGEIRGSIHALR